VITANMATIFFALSLLGVLGFAGLLVLGLRMWGEEMAAKRKALNRPPSDSKAETEPLPAASAEPSASTEPAPGQPSTEPLPPETSAAPQEAAPSAAEAAAQVGAPAIETKASPAPEARAPGRIPALFSRPAAGQEILRVVRDGPARTLTVLVAGKAYANFHDLQDELTEQEFMSAFSHLQAFAQNAVVKPATPAPEGSPAEVPAPPPARVVYHTAELPPLEVPSMRPLQQFQRLRKKTEAPKIVIKSITEQIEDHLQGRIAGTLLSRRGLHVRAEARGNAVFLYDGKVYAAVDDVPDGEAQQAIREAIADWEKKT
jgi:hypothetical protein